MVKQIVVNATTQGIIGKISDTPPSWSLQSRGSGYHRASTNKWAGKGFEGGLPASFVMGACAAHLFLRREREWEENVIMNRSKSIVRNVER